MTPRHRIIAIALAALCGAGLAAAPAHAQGFDPDEVDPAVDGPITAGLLAGALAATLLPVDTDASWDHQIFGGLDDLVKDNFSASAAGLSDGLLTMTVAAPVLLRLPSGVNGDTGRYLLLYAEAVSTSVFANALTKYLVARPRPYTYNPDPRVQEYAREQGKDSHLSFYSGHSSTAFSAAVAGSYLFSLGDSDRKAKAVVWLVHLSLAAATANLRVRAGKHFYSDVVIGAAVGSAVGVLIPAVHAGEGGMRMPSSLEWGAIAGGVILGSVVSQFIPLHSDILTPLESDGLSLQVAPVGFTPAPGLGISGTF
ncbi:phosphatase PAP2 family protein [Haliangium sp.]|uniref:phosphatase PAP2 family protein n=1 Tax=Haliangium sp. TaxID=2663208 RepID=UPI003D0B7FAD